MADIWMDVDTALSEVPVNVMPLIDDTDFKTRETGVAYNAAGMDLVWNFVDTAGNYTQTAVTPTTAGSYDWTHQGDGMYSIEIPASGGASINNDTEGFGWFSGIATGVLPWRGPIIGFRAAGLNNALIDSAYSTTRGLGGTALPDAAAEAAGGLYTRGAGAGQINQDANGRVDVSLKAILGTTLTETAGQIAAAFKKFFDKASPTGTVNSIPDAVAGTNGGLPTVDASNRVAGMQGTKHTLDDLNDLSAAGVRSAVGLASANLDTQIATLATLTKLLKYVQLLARKDSAIATDNATELTAINANGGSGAGAYDNATDAQEALRDRGDAAWITVAAATIRSAVGLASANLDTQLDAIPTANENADAHLDRADAIEAGITPRGAHRLAVAAAAGKVDGAATTTMHVRDVADGKNRVTATVDANGNRTATSVDVS